MVVPNFNLHQITAAFTDVGADNKPQALGWFLIDSPPGVVADVTSRDVSGLEFLDSQSPQKHDMATHTLHFT